MDVPKITLSWGPGLTPVDMPPVDLKYFCFCGLEMVPVGEQDADGYQERRCPNAGVNHPKRADSDA